MFGQVQMCLVGGHIRCSPATVGGFLPDFEAQIPPVGIFLGQLFFRDIKLVSQYLLTDKLANI